MSALRLMVGLGNPGPEYEQTRHNAGFWFVDRVAHAHGGSWRRESRFHGDVARISLPSGDLWLLKPSTFMNESGRAVAAMARFYQILPSEILVVHDELDLQPGVVKLKKAGGSAGHNGLKDTSAALGSPDYWRLRVGIGHPGERPPVADYVLRRATRDEQESIDTALDRAEEVFPLIGAGDLDAALLKLHTAN
jgi:PTH1 family peptidyl-tRNA hydrolase